MISAVFRAYIRGTCPGRDMANIVGQDREASDRVIAGTVYTDTLVFSAGLDL
jgi:hypothetical protein